MGRKLEIDFRSDDEFDPGTISFYEQYCEKSVHNLETLEDGSLSSASLVIPKTTPPISDCGGYGEKRSWQPRDT